MYEVDLALQSEAFVLLNFLVEMITAPRASNVINATSLPRQAQKRKLQSFLEGFKSAPKETEPQQENPSSSSSYLSSMMDIEAFLEALSAASSEDGRVILTGSSSLDACSLRFIPLNPANHFHGNLAF